MKKLLISAFSLIELTLALGVAACCLMAVFGLMPVGVQTNRNATSQTLATDILAAVDADLRATPKAAGTWTGTSSAFRIPIGTSKTLYFDSEVRCSTDLAGSTSPCGVFWTPPYPDALSSQGNVFFDWKSNLCRSQGRLASDVRTN